MLKPCLFELSKFIEEYLEPNKLKYFDIEAIKVLKDCPVEDNDDHYKFLNNCQI